MTTDLSAVADRTFDYVIVGGGVRPARSLIITSTC